MTKLEEMKAKYPMKDSVVISNDYLRELVSKEFGEELNGLKLEEALYLIELAVRSREEK